MKQDFEKGLGVQAARFELWKRKRLLRTEFKKHLDCKD
jgi:hypothetical protein